VAVRFSCRAPSSESIKSRLNIILDDDLEAICSQLRMRAPEELLEKPYYKIIEYKHYKDKAAKYSITNYTDRGYNYNAVVEFYYFNNIIKKQVRKYRFNYIQDKWERYFKEYKTIGVSPDSVFSPEMESSYAQ
ncbi:MAG: hypothetical protein ABIA63_06060, partial [bacterium]